MNETGKQGKVQCMSAVSELLHCRIAFKAERDNKSYFEMICEKDRNTAGSEFSITALDGGSFDST